MSHQLQGERAGLINPSSTTPSSTSCRPPIDAAQITRLEFLREAGTEGIELIMWLIMRAALGDERRGAVPLLSRARVEHRGGHIVLRPTS
jgi:protocatechuate 4,5-dioxygenase beta chain